MSEDAFAGQLESEIQECFREGVASESISDTICGKDVAGRRLPLSEGNRDAFCDSGVTHP